MSCKKTSIDSKPIRPSQTKRSDRHNEKSASNA